MQIIRIYCIIVQCFNKTPVLCYHLSPPRTIALCLIFVLGTQYSCIDDGSSYGHVDKLTVTPQIKDKLTEAFAKALAEALRHSEVREFVRKNALQRFDGDNNFLFQFSKNAPVTGSIKTNNQKSLSFSEMLFPDIERARNNSGFNLLDSLALIHPLLQIAIPTLSTDSIEIWDVAEQIPLVAFVPQNAGEEIPAYDANGTKYALNAKEEPDRLVIVVSENERVMAIPKSSNGRKNYDDVFCMQLTPVYSTDYYDYYYRADYYEAVNSCYSGGGGNGYGGGHNSNPATCDRLVNFGKDRFGKFKFNSMKILRDAEAWIDGKPELRCIITLGAHLPSNFNTLNKVFTEARHEFKDCDWFGINCWPTWVDFYPTEVVTWDKALFGNLMKYTWIEEDNGDPIELTLNHTTQFDNGDGSKTSVGGSVKVTIKHRDYLLGESIVEYCDKTANGGYTYNTGLISFQVRQ